MNLSLCYPHSKKGVQQDSNPQPSALQHMPLPTELMEQTRNRHFLKNFKHEKETKMNFAIFGPI